MRPAARRAARSGRREVVVVTGASAGVGRAVARGMARQGADVALLARGSAGLEGARREVEEAGGRALVIPVDVADAAAVDEAASRVEAELGPIDVWINDAMTTVFGRFLDLDEAEYRRVTEVTYLGFVNGTRAALRRMLPSDHGTVVQVGSALAYRSIPLQSAYCGAKHAMVGFTDSLRCELIHDRSRVWLTVVHLPALNTPQFDWCANRMPRHSQPVPPIYQPEVAARAICFAARHRRREVWVGAPTALAILGQRLAPWLGDLVLGRRGFDSQQHDGAAARGPGNLFSPGDVMKDHGAHGAFDGRAHGRSPAAWMSLHRAATLSVVASLASALALAGAIRARRRGVRWSAGCLRSGSALR